MKKHSPLSLGGLFLFALLQFVFSTTALAQSENSGVTIRVTIGGVSTDYVEGECGFGPAQFGAFPDYQLCAPAEWGHSISGDTLGCDSIPVGSLTGKIGLVRRGACPAPNTTGGNFVVKAFNLQRAGADAVLVANHYSTAAQTSCSVQTMGGADPAVTVPVFFLSRAMAEAIDAGFASGQAVEVCILPPVVKMESAFYPVQNVQTPISQIATDTFGFSVNLTNAPGVDLTNVVVTAQVLEEDGDELFSSSISIPTLTADVVDSLFIIPGLFVPDLPLGKYFLKYTAQSDPVAGNDTKHVVNNPFYVTESLFAKDDNTVTSGLQPGSIPDAGWGVGNLYIMTAGSLDQYRVQTVEFSHAVNANTVPINEVNADLFLFKVRDTVANDWNLFEGTDFFSSSFELLGSGAYEAPANAANYQLQQVEIIDLNSAEPGVLLENGANYVVAAFYPDSSRVAFNAFDLDVEAAGPNGLNTFTYSTQWFLGGFTSGCCAILRMYIDLVVTTDETPLPDNYMKVFPNPVKDVLNLGLNLDKPTDITVTIAEMSGRTILIQDRQGMTNETLTYQVPQLAAGTYLARIATKEGTLTKKFIVQK